MDDFSMVNGIFAVVVLLLGAGLGFYTQRRQAAEARREDLRARLRQERVDAYCDFGSALRAYRRAQIHRWRSGNSDTGEASTSAESARDAAAGALFRVQLLASDSSVSEPAVTALKDMNTFREANSSDQFERTRNMTDARIRAFTAAARSELDPHVSQRLDTLVQPASTD
ncbi:hypothetical protein [Isoptericola haloaureus]|uniref:Secreted protein n=1 Tax=Isoptericola haloaureus TaxID=1542902 RepID=A0ABU7Z849_9MICO